MSFLWNIVGLGGSIPNFPFKIDSAKPEYIHNTATLCWTIRQGTRVEDDKPVSIFTVSIAKGKAHHDPKNENRGVLARNALKYSKSLMLPGVLRCYGGVEYDGTIYIATERCDPLSRVLASVELLHEYYTDPVGQRYEQGVALGLKNVGEALIGLQKNELMHGNVCAETVYVTANGFWRLWGLELVSVSRAEAGRGNHDTNVYHQLAADFLPRYRIPDGMGGGRNAAVDAWGMSCLIFEAFRGRSSINIDTASLSSKNVHNCKRQLPDSLQASFRRLFSDKGVAHSGIAQFLEKCDFIRNSAYVQCLGDIDQYMLMDTTQREAFIDRLGSAVVEFPLRVCLRTILPKLMELIQMDTPPVNIMNPVIEIAKLVVDDTAFETHIAPCLVLLFQSTNVVIHYSLLQSIDVYGSRLSPAMLEKIWPLFTKGISSTSASIRDGSVRALVHIAGQLNPRVLSKEVPFLLQKVQGDPDGTIRTNATIALSMISHHMPPEVRRNVLVSASGRMLKDPFAPSRVAALQILSTVLAELKSQELSEVVIPRIVPLVTDPVGDVREHAISILKSALEKFEVDHQLCLEQERAHKLQCSQQQDTVSNETQQSHSLKEGATSRESRAGWFQGSSIGKSPLHKPSHSHSLSLPSYQESNTSYPGPARDFPQSLQQQQCSDACDGWDDDEGNLKASKEDYNTKDTFNGTWGEEEEEEVEMPRNEDLPTHLVSSLEGGSKNGSWTFGGSSLHSTVPLSENRIKTSLKSATVLLSNNTPANGVTKSEKPANVMKLLSKKKSLGAVRLD